MENNEVKHPDSPVDESTRLDLKTAIDKHGRRDFCQTMKLNYMQVSNQLNGATTLRNCVADYYRDSLAVLHSARRGRGSK